MSQDEVETPKASEESGATSSAKPSTAAKKSAPRKKKTTQAARPAAKKRPVVAAADATRTRDEAVQPALIDHRPDLSLSGTDAPTALAPVDHSPDLSLGGADAPILQLPTDSVPVIPQDAPAPPAISAVEAAELAKKAQGDASEAGEDNAAAVEESAPASDATAKEVVAETAGEVAADNADEKEYPSVDDIFAAVMADSDDSDVSEQKTASENAASESDAPTDADADAGVDADAEVNAVAVDAPSAEVPVADAEVELEQAVVEPAVVEPAVEEPAVQETEAEATHPATEQDDIDSLFDVDLEDETVVVRGRGAARQTVDDAELPSPEATDVEDFAGASEVVHAAVAPERDNRSHFVPSFSPQIADSGEEVDPETAALYATGLLKIFGGHRAVDDIDLKVPAGSFYGIVGPNGAGKTTTLSMIAGLLKPDDGSIRVCGVDARKNSRAAKKLIGVLPDRLRTFDRLTGRQLLTYFGSLRGLSGRDIEKRVADLARAFDLTDALGRVVSDYSAGMTKKVMLAGALIHSPRLLILDEPFESVDPVSAAVILDILTAYVQGGGTVILSSHGMDLVERVCSRLAVIVSGHVLAEGTVEQVRGGLTLEQRFVELSGSLTDVEGLEWLHTYSA